MFERTHNIVPIIISQVLFSSTTEITKLMANSRDAAELEHLWVSWRNSSGRQVRELYKEYVQLLNEAALKNSKLPKISLIFERWAAFACSFLQVPIPMSFCNYFQTSPMPP